MAENIISRKEARAQGLRHYFTGKPCIHGHIAKRCVRKKRCAQCNRERTANWRAANPQRSRDSLRKFRQNHPEKISSWHKAWRAKNPEKITASRERERQRRLADPDKFRAKSREKLRQWRSKNLERARERERKWEHNNRERRRELHKKWWRDNPEKKREKERKWRLRNTDKIRAKNIKTRVIRRVRQKAAIGSFTGKDLREILVAQNGRCAYCGENIRRKYHVDHIAPLVRGGSNERKNIQLTCAACNLKKNGKDPLEFGRSLGRLL
jgi:hypothetical protein